MPSRPLVSYEFYGRGELPTAWTMGDYILVSAGTWNGIRLGHVPWVSHLIQIGQGLRFRGSRRRFAHWNHAAWVSSNALIEAQASGVAFSPYGKYRQAEFVLVHSDLTDAERADGDAFVRWCAEEHYVYGFVIIVSIALSLLTGLKFSFGFPGVCICSGLLAAALGAPQWRADPSHVMPGDIAEYKDIRLPPQLVR